MSKLNEYDNRDSSRNEDVRLVEMNSTNIVNGSNLEETTDHILIKNATNCTFNVSISDCKNPQ